MERTKSMTHNPTQANEAVLTYLVSLFSTGFWGSIEVKFQDGQITHMRREENLRPNELPGYRMKTDDHQHNPTT
jgi:hypothetical protein